MFSIINFYKFVTIEDVDTLRLEQMRLGARLGLKGTILLSPEGANVMLSGSREALDDYLTTINQDHRFRDLHVMWTSGEVNPFRRLKVKKKDYIVVFDPNHKVSPEEISSAPYMNTAAWRALLESDQKDVVVLDTRNYYEHDYGTFKGAEHLNIRNFRQFPEKFLERYGDQKDKTYLMFCTGGIRCEKAAVFARKQGFEHVYQLDGGILNYFEDQGAAAYQGACFVFDYRWAVNPSLTQSKDGPHPDQLNRVHDLAT